MAFEQKSSGKPSGGVSSFLYGTDPVANVVPNKTGWQQASQMLLQPQVLNNLFRGWQAPSIAPAQREATRHFQEEVVPGLLNNVAAGGSEGAYLRGLQGAGSDLQSKLAALQQEQQFKLQQQRQEQIPKLFELAQQSPFSTHISDKPINWSEADNPNNQRTTSGQLAESEPIQRILQGGRNIGGALNRKLNEPQQPIPQGRGLKIAASKIPPATLNRLKQAYQFVEKGTKPELAHGINPVTNPKVRAGQDRVDRILGKGFNFNPEVLPKLGTADFRNIKSVLKKHPKLKDDILRDLPNLTSQEDLKEYLRLIGSTGGRSKVQKFLRTIATPLGLRKSIDRAFGEI